MVFLTKIKSDHVYLPLGWRCGAQLEDKEKKAKERKGENLAYPPPTALRQVRFACRL